MVTVIYKCFGKDTRLIKDDVANSLKRIWITMKLLAVIADEKPK